MESSLPASLDLVAAGIGVTVLAGHAAERQTVPGVIYLPLVDAPSIDVGLFWRRDLQFAGSVISPVLELLPAQKASPDSDRKTTLPLGGSAGVTWTNAECER